jgi:hypothetical protein
MNQQRTLVNMVMNVQVCKMLGYSWVAERLVASQEGLSYVELIGWLVQPRWVLVLTSACFLLRITGRCTITHCREFSAGLRAVLHTYIHKYPVDSYAYHVPFRSECIWLLLSLEKIENRNSTKVIHAFFTVLGQHSECNFRHTRLEGQGHMATSWKVTGSRPNEVNFFQFT